MVSNNGTRTGDLWRRTIPAVGAGAGSFAKPNSAIPLEPAGSEVFSVWPMKPPARFRRGSTGGM